MKTLSLFASLLLCSSAALAATKPVPSSCTPEVNAPLVHFLHDNASNPSAQLNNVMVCGTATVASFEQPASHTGTGAHQVVLLTINTPDGPVVVEIVSNDALDGIVQAAAGDAIYAYGQAYITSAHDIRLGKFHPKVGIHDTHCATNTHMDDGWVVVNQKHYPAASCSTNPHHRHKQ